MDFSTLLSSSLTSSAADQIAEKLGVDSTTAKKMIALGAPILLNQLAKNASTEEGADALYKALDKHTTAKKSITETDSPDALKILGHIFGSEQETATQKIAQETGTSASQANSILSALAPVLMGALGQQKASGGLDLGSLATILTNATKTNSSNNLMMSLATNLLDKDHDGDIKDDLLTMSVNWIKKKIAG